VSCPEQGNFINQYNFKMKVLKALKNIGLPATVAGKMRRIAAGGLVCVPAERRPACVRGKHFADNGTTILRIMI
jgi:hypothetical protein